MEKKRKEEGGHAIVHNMEMLSRMKSRKLKMQQLQQYQQ
jgi:hypothetical protein